MARKTYEKVTAKEFAAQAAEVYPSISVLTRAEIIEIAHQNLIGVPDEIWTSKVERGKYDLAVFLDGTAPTTKTPKKVPKKKSKKEDVAPIPNQTDSADELETAVVNDSGVLAVSRTEESYIPQRSKTFVPWGLYNPIVKIIRSETFYPTYITGLSGNGKTETVEQACAFLRREFFRVNFTVETNEDDLMGGFRLVNGETVFQFGPVLEAMRRGAVLLLDEIDLGSSSKIMCLQSVLEGKGYYAKKINMWIQPKKGFQVFLTGNTKGKGSDDGQFVATNILNEAFLDRISCTLEQDYPPAPVEKKILSIFYKNRTGEKSISETVDNLIQNLVKWTQSIRKSYEDGAVSEIITTRRLVHIMSGYIVFEDVKTALQQGVARFDKDTADSFLSLYDKMDGNVDMTAEEKEEEKLPF